jgi:hypothetical protein
MITSYGLGLITELIATVLLIAALTGFAIRRSQPWLIGVAVAMTLFVVAVTIVVRATT